MKTAAVIFDLDGTLLNTIKDLADSVNEALESFGFPLHSVEEIQSFVGNGMYRLVERSVPEGTLKETTDRVFSKMLERYAVNKTNHTKPYSGITEMLQELNDRGIKCAVVSNKNDAEVKSLCSNFFGNNIILAEGSLPGRKIKPSPDTVLEVMEKLGTCRENTLFCGDSEVDIYTARNAGLKCISVTWGFKTEAFLKETGAEYMASSPEMVLNLSETILRQN